MTSPFPGMDPYLEDPGIWPDFHFTFIGSWREAVADVLPEHYEARIEERIHLVQMSPEVIQLIYPDVAVSRKHERPHRKAKKSGVLLLEPVTIPNEYLEEVREYRIEILHRPDRSLVAVLEMLSPTNKTGDGFAEYRAKRNAVLSQQAHLVELDLLKGGQRLPLRKPLPPADYYAFVSRADHRPNCDVFPWTLRQVLPAIPIPLKNPDPDVIINLEKVFREAYKRGRYEQSLRYGAELLAPFEKKDKNWALQQVSKKKSQKTA